MKNILTVNGAVPGSTMILTDMTGKTLIKQSAGGNGIDQVETRKLSSGTYLLKIISADGKTINVKLNKQ